MTPLEAPSLPLANNGGPCTGETPLHLALAEQVLVLLLFLLINTLVQCWPCHAPDEHVPWAPSASLCACASATS